MGASHSNLGIYSSYCARCPPSSLDAPFWDYPRRPSTLRLLVVAASFVTSLLQCTVKTLVTRSRNTSWVGRMFASSSPKKFLVTIFYRNIELRDPHCCPFIRALSILKILLKKVPNRKIYHILKNRNFTCFVSNMPPETNGNGKNLISRKKCQLF